MSKQLRDVALILSVILANPAVTFAQTRPQFIFPLACTYGKDCWAVNYVDVDPASGAVKDFMCKSKTYDAHKGTDFALGSVTQMKNGVDVLAVAEGTVLRLRDGEDDLLKAPAALEEIKSNKKECGNGIIIDHGNGLQTIYCHLKQDSIIVKPKDRIRTGQKIAQVGQSGLAEFPHLHLGITWEGGIIDPYTGAQDIKGCGQMQTPLWADVQNIVYEPVAIFDGGFRALSPDFPAIQRGDDLNPETLPRASAAFVFWSGFYNVEDGDEITLVMIDPEGKEFNRRSETVPQTRARQYYYTGRKLGNVQLINGEYQGIATLKRTSKNGEKPITRTKTFTVRVTD